MFSLPIPLLIVPIGLFVLIVYFAVSKKSSLLIRWTAIMALILIGISTVVCLFILFAEPEAIVINGPNINIISEKEATVVSKANPLLLLICAAVLLLFIAFVVYHALQEQQRLSKKDKEKS
ncbi:MAG: hypothetical protein LBD29_01435 [Treponema sp.]|jgi:uncharacterized membrane protein YjgN (DUF898 family)|nr:hypothetical protein [Treponema sp.]